jgi:hypothetical protein
MAGGVQLSNCLNRLLGELGRASALTPWRISPSVAPLCPHVVHIVFVRPKEQVRRIHAEPVVAFVADEHPSRNGAKMYLPREAVRADVLAIPAHYSIALRVLDRGPFPTTVSTPNA